MRAPTILKKLAQKNRRFERDRGGFCANEEADLVRRISHGDSAAFSIVYEQMSPIVFRFALGMCASPTVAEDITQDTFLIVMRNIRNFDPARSRLISWLLGITRNVCRRTIEPAHDEFLDEGEDTAATGDPLEELSHREMVDAVRQAVLALPAPYREVVVLCELEEMDYLEVAGILNCPIGTVRSRLHRGRNLLLSKLQTRCFV